ncbi:hypothetical protein C8R43DRAFT_1132199 [Mycena crocata]|nr:hypothetical protein C8R43DRAFT_1132199 [Mycena crocata]
MFDAQTKQQQHSPLALIPPPSPSKASPSLSPLPSQYPLFILWPCITSLCTLSAKFNNVPPLPVALRQLQHGFADLYNLSPAFEPVQTPCHAVFDDNLGPNTGDDRLDIVYDQDLRLLIGCAPAQWHGLLSRNTCLMGCLTDGDIWVSGAKRRQLFVPFWEYAFHPVAFFTTLAARKFYWIFRGPANRVTCSWSWFYTVHFTATRARGAYGPALFNYAPHREFCFKFGTGITYLLTIHSSASAVAPNSFNLQGCIIFLFVISTSTERCDVSKADSSTRTCRGA